MTTPSTPNATKSIRVTADVHARLQRIVDTTGCQTHSDAVQLLLSRATVGLFLDAEQLARWDEAAKNCGMSTADFVKARVEAALQYGADPGALRRIHDMTYSLCRAAGINPRQLSTPGADRQVIHAPDEARRTA